MSELLPADHIETLLPLPASERNAWLRENAYFNEEGTRLLLETADHLFGHNVTDAGKIAAVAENVATEIASNLLPRAHYLQAQHAAMQGEWKRATTLITQARDGYMANGDQAGVHRTVPGMMWVLGQQGKHENAIQLADQTLTEVDADSPLQSILLINKAHNQLELGQYDSVLMTYAELTSVRSQLSSVQHVDSVNNHAIALSKLGRTSEALALLAQLIPADTPGINRAYRLHNQAELARLAADYPQSLTLIEQAQQLFTEANEPIRQLACWIDTAEILLTLNLLDDATAALSHALTLLESLDVPYESGRAHRLNAAIAHRKEALDTAETAYQTALDIFAQLGNVAEQAAVQTEYAKHLLSKGAIPNAQTIATRALALAESKQLPIHTTFAHLALLDIALADDDLPAAKNRLTAVTPLINALNIPALTYRLHTRDGLIQQIERKWEAAESSFSAAISLIESIRATLHQETLRTSFLDDKLTPYTALIQLYLDNGNFENALTVADRSRSRTLTESMQGMVTDQFREPLPDETAERLQTLRTDLNAIYNSMLADAGDDRTANNVTHQRATQIEQEIRAITFPSSPRPPLAPPGGIKGGREFGQAALSAADLIPHIPADHPHIIYHILGNELLAFVIVGGKLHIKRHLTTVDALRPHLTKLRVHWDRMKTSRSLLNHHANRLERALKKTLHAIDGLLFAPLLPYLSPSPSNAGGTVRSLTIIPHGTLHTIPFHALWNGTAWRIEQFAFSYMPSLTASATLHTRNRPIIQTGQNGAIFGCTDPELQAVATETAAIRHHTNGAHYLDDTATRAQFDQAIETADWLHIASHGLFRSHNPYFSAVRLGNDWLTAHDILRLPHTPDLVTLSACDSGQYTVSAGDETAGLATAFLARGTTSVIASQWRIQDDIAATLMPIFYTTLSRDQNRAHALRTAQLHVKQEHSHPWYWASCRLIGRN